MVKYSVLDSLWPSWSSRSPSARRELVGFQSHNARHWHLFRRLRRNTVDGTTSAKDDECPIPRNDQRIFKGMLRY